jgi:hypothetical protein
MLTPVEIGALVTAAKGAVDLLDKFGGQLISFLRKGPKVAEQDVDAWRIRIDRQGDDIVVRRQGQTIQTVTHDQLATKLQSDDLALVQTYEKKMNEYFSLWRSVYDEKDVSADPLVNAKTDAQLQRLILKMRGELLGILRFLEQTGVRLDDHYLSIRRLVQDAEKDRAS